MHLQCLCTHSVLRGPNHRHSIRQVLQMQSLWSCPLRGLEHISARLLCDGHLGHTFLEPSVFQVGFGPRQPVQNPSILRVDRPFHWPEKANTLVGASQHALFVASACSWVVGASPALLGILVARPQPGACLECLAYAPNRHS